MTSGNAGPQPRRVRLIKAAEHFGKLDRPSFEKMLNMLTRLLRDLLILASGGPESEITNIDEHSRLARPGTHSDPHESHRLEREVQ